MPSADHRPLTVAAVEAACATLRAPAWQRILDDHPDLKPSATLIPIVDVGGRAATVVTRRADALSHGGDWVFPGGRLDDRDADHAQAARREAAEELGVAIDRIRIVGQLDRRGPIVTGHIIDTHIGIIDATKFVPEPREVTDIAIVALDDFLMADRSRRAPIPAAARHRRESGIDATLPSELPDMLYYEIRPGEDLWGMQADMLHELLHHVTAGGHCP